MSSIAGNEYRLGSSALIDRSQFLDFYFNDRHYQGFQGDTLASALLANGVGLVARSVKYHRPRGIMSAGIEETNALVKITYPQPEPTAQATRVPLTQGLRAYSLSGYPGVRWDIGALNELISRLLPAGFYYKTFMWLPWPVYARFIRPLAGLGTLPASPSPTDTEGYEKRYWHCDLLIIGAGPSGLAAAQLAARSGARVVLVDQQSRPGGGLLASPASIAAKPALEWISEVVAEIDSYPDTMRLSEASAAGFYDHNLITVVEHRPQQMWLRERLWRIRARRIILATGAIERPLVFVNNDRPGIFLASAIRCYLHRFAVRCGERTIFFTNNDSAYAGAFELAAAAHTVIAIVDSRPSVDRCLREQAKAWGIDLLIHYYIVKAHGNNTITGITLGSYKHPDLHRYLSCDSLGVSGGWSPAIHLHSQSGAKPVYDELQACFIPGRSVQPERSVGAARGQFDLQAGLADGLEAATASLIALGIRPAALECPQTDAGPALNLHPTRPAPRGRGKAFIDYQHDVTTADLDLALRENYRSVEHIKRYTTAGMAMDQGKTSNSNIISYIAARLRLTPPQIGTTTFRPPFSPISFGAIAGLDQQQLIIPARYTPLSDWHVSAGGVLDEAGAHFRRPAYYLRVDETKERAIQRAAVAARTRAGIYDGSPLGKFDLQGPDVVTFLNRIYTNQWQNMTINQGRFGLMLREDGRLLDDSVGFRLAPNRYLLFTGSGVAEPVYTHMERLLQCEWPELKVYLTDISGQWVNICVCGPRARAILRATGTDIDLDAQAFPFLTLRTGRVAGIAARVMRVGYTGELSFEISVAARDGLKMWQALMSAGKPYDITPIGSQTNAVLRIEKGFIAASTEGDNITNPFDAGLGRVVDMTKGDFIGRRSLVRDRNTGGIRQQVVGLLPQNGQDIPAEGSALIDISANNSSPVYSGHVTASCYSPNLKRAIALALLADGRQRKGDIVTIAGIGKPLQAQVTDSVFIDPEGRRMRG